MNCVFAIEIGAMIEKVVAKNAGEDSLALQRSLFNVRPSLI
jgi:hypothetical protein